MRHFIVDLACIWIGLFSYFWTEITFAYSPRVDSTSLCPTGSVVLAKDSFSVQKPEQESATQSCKFKLAEMVNDLYSSKFDVTRNQCTEIWPVAKVLPERLRYGKDTYSFSVHLTLCCLKRPGDPEATELLNLINSSSPKTFALSLSDGTTTLMHFSGACEGCSISGPSREKECLVFANHGFRETLVNTIYHSISEDICHFTPSKLPLDPHFDRERIQQEKCAWDQFATGCIK